MKEIFSNYLCNFANYPRNSVWVCLECREMYRFFKKSEGI